MNQTYKNWELLIIDDGSKDNSLAIAKKYENKNITILSNEKNSGVIYSRNRGIDSSKGELLSFIDSDDTWLEDKLQKQIKVMEDADIFFSCTAYNIVDKNNKIINKFFPPHKITYRSMLNTCSIGTSTVMVSRDILGESRFKGIYGREDYILWLDLIRRSPVISIHDRLTNYKVAGEALSSNKLHMAKLQWLVYYKYLNLGLLKSLYFFLHYMISGLKKSKHLLKRFLILQFRKWKNTDK